MSYEYEINPEDDDAPDANGDRAADRLRDQVRKLMRERKLSQADGRFSDPPLVKFARVWGGKVNR